MKKRMRFLTTLILSATLCFSSLVHGAELNVPVVTAVSETVERDLEVSTEMAFMMDTVQTSEENLIVTDDTEGNETVEDTVDESEAEQPNALAEENTFETNENEIVEERSLAENQIAIVSEPDEENGDEVLNGLIMTEDGNFRYLIDGVAQTGLQKVEVDGTTHVYYFEKDGNAFTGGLKCLDSGRYYFLKNGQAFNKGILQFVHTNGNSYTYYFQPDGTAFMGGYRCCYPGYKADAEGNLTYEDEGRAYYYFQNNGVAFTGGFLEVVLSNGRTYYYYFLANGRAYTDGYKSVPSKYRANSDGTIERIATDKIDYYYFQPDGFAFTGGLLQLVNKNGAQYTYCFRADGTAYTDGYKSVITRYAADPDGNLTNISDGVKYYYFKKDGQAYKDGFLRFVHTSGVTYDFYYNSDGCALTSAIKTISTRHYADANGKITDITDGRSYKYRFADDGKGELTGNGWVYDGKTWNYFDGTGARVASSNGMYKAWGKIKNTSSATKYFLVVDCTNCETYIFKGRAGDWVPYKCWKCSPGKSSTPTIKGTFTVGSRGYSFSGPKGSTLTYTCYYWTQIKGGYLFHSVLYKYKTFDIDDGRLGRNLSHGCVRLALENAKWIYDNVPSGSKILTY